MRKKIAALFAALLLAVQASPQPGDKYLPLVTLYDLDATTLTYCVTLGAQGSADGDWIAVRKLLTTSGSSTTVTALTASEDPFTVVAAGDEILFVVQNIEYPRLIMTNADDDTITVDAAIDLSLTFDGGAYWKYRNRSCGTAATDGWFSVRNYSAMTVFLQVGQLTIDAGTIDFSVQCRSEGVDADPVDIYSTVTEGYRTGGYNAAQVDNDALTFDLATAQFAACRVGMVLSDDDATDTGVAAEQITTKAVLRGRR